MSDPTLTIAFADEAGDGETHWIRLEQVEMQDEGVTMEQAAELIDALYGIEVCENGLGNGGWAADEDDLPEEAEFLDMARQRLPLDICDQGESATWETEMDVFRSHQDDGYRLQGERVEVGATTPMSKTVTESVEVNGATCDLSWPCDGDVSVAGAVVADVRGSTVNFAAPVRGRVRIRYRAVWDRVRLTVRRNAANAAGAGASAVSGGASKTSSREDDSASVVAFWRDLAAECSLTRPPEDDDIDPAELRRICDPDASLTVKGECWQTIETYNLCNCSGSEAKDAPEPVDEDAPCPEGVRPGSWLGMVRRLGRYVECSGEEDEELNSVVFFKEHCCEDSPPYSPLPRCRETREPWRGGEEIENGAEYWRNLYGDTVRLTPVTPEGGNCGELVKIWDVPSKNCCEDAQPLVLSATDMDISALTEFSLTLAGDAPPYQWRAEQGVELLGVSPGGETAFFKTGDSGQWCEVEIRVKGACGGVAKCVVRNAGRGRWLLLSEYASACELPFLVGNYVNPPDPLGNIAGTRELEKVGRYQAIMRIHAYGPTRLTLDELKKVNPVAASHFERCGAGNEISPGSARLFGEHCGRWKDDGFGSNPTICSPAKCGCECHSKKLGTKSWVYITEEVDSVYEWICSDDG